MSSNKSTDEFYKSLSDTEKKAYEIAKDHLETSFDVEKCIYYLKWKSKK